MALIGKKGLDVKKDIGDTNSSEVASPNKTGLTADQKFNLVLAILGGVAVACILAMLAMLASWLQFTNNSFAEYSKVITEYNDKRHGDLEDRVKKLENENETIRNVKIETQINEIKKESTPSATPR